MAVRANPAACRRQRVAEPATIATARQVILDAAQHVA